MKQLLLASLITLLAIGTACGQAPESEPEPVASDSIQVHGQWTVTVTNPDGTVDAVHEFENALGDYGSDVLTAVILGEADITNFTLDLSQGQGFIPYALVCEESLNQQPKQSWDRINLGVTRNFLVKGSPISLTGLCTVDTTQEEVLIPYVFTVAKLDKMISVYGPKEKMGEALTNHWLIDPIKVANDQTIAFNITISFS